ncbi:MAG TPA: hypothetical protein VF118_08365 [Gemmatimonadaceae bacterium]
MTDLAHGRRWTVSATAIVAIIVLSIPVSGEAIGARFFESLRIARPAPVAPGSPALASATGSRQLEQVVAGILSDTTLVATDEPDRAVSTTAAAAPLIAFRPRLVGARGDSAAVSIVGAHSVAARVDVGQLRTLLTEAGRASDTIPPSIDHLPVSFAVPRGVRVAYGNCPAPQPSTIAAQLNGPPPPTAENSSCVVLTETPLPEVRVPPALDTAAVLELALELTGMSPNQARDFRQLFGWRESLVLAPPRFMRSYELVPVGTTRGMLMVTSGRRGPAYELAWADAGVVFALTGYGSAADAAPLARSVAP